MRLSTIACLTALGVGLGVGCSGGSSSGDGAGSSSGGEGAQHTASGGGSGGASGSGSGSSGGVVVTPGDGGGSCLGATFLQALGRKELIVGAQMEAATAKLAPFDFQSMFISGGLPDGTGPCTSCTSDCSTNGTSCASGGCAWWGCWQDTSQAPGQYPKGYESTCASESPAQIPMITYYQLLQSSGVAEGTGEVTQAANDTAFMTRYLADWRFLLQQIGTTRVILHIEPDFWGYAENNASDPTTEAAAVASANATDCGSQPNTIAGLGKCMIAMARKYAPKALVGLHASAWSTKTDVSLNASASFDMAGEAAKTAAFLAACGQSDADFVAVDTSNYDAGYTQTVKNQDTWWDATNATLPDFAQYFVWTKALTEALGTPALFWNTPLGNSAQNNTPTHYQDNRVDYFFSHMDQLAAAHAVGAMFGAGPDQQTAPETDGNNFVDKAKAYYAAGGQGLCP